MPDARTMTRRLLPAAAVTLACLLAFGTALGVANAAAGEGSAPDGAPAVLIPAPSLGDRGSYEAWLEGDWAEASPSSPLDLLSFEWREGQARRDGHGFVVETDELAITGWRYHAGGAQADHDGDGQADGSAWTREDRIEIYRKGTLESVGVLSHMTEAEGAHVPGPVPGYPDVLAQSFRFAHDEAWLEYTPDGAPAGCLLVHALQGTTVSGPAEYAPHCELAGLFATAGLSLEPVGIETVRGWQTLRLRATGLADEPVSGFDVWLAAGLPVPVRMDVQLPEGVDVTASPDAPPMPHGPRSVRIELASFEPGDRPRAPGAAPSDPVPDLAVAARKPWGLDESGVALDFPAATAYRRAIEDPTFGDLRDFLQAHPKAAISLAANFPMQGDGALGSSVWAFGFSDREASLIVLVERQAPQALAGLGPEIQDAASVYRFHSMESDVGGPDADTVPAELPTAAALLGRWQAYASADKAVLEPNSLLYAASCVDEECSEVFLTFGAGHLHIASTKEVDPAGPALRQAGEYVGSQLYVRPDLGAAWMLVESSVTFAQAAGVVPEESGGDGVSSLAPSATGPARGLLPGPLEAASAGALAVLVGLAYWLWPVLKSGPILGFSRLRPARLLESPLRSRIHDVVAAEPGIHFQELARRTGIANGTLTHHLRKLVAAELLVAHRAGRYTCYFPKSSPRAQRSAAGVTKSEGARAVLDAVQRHPGATMQDVAATCGLQASTVTYHVQRLAEAGLVSVRRDGRFQRVQPSAAA